MSRCSKCTGDAVCIYSLCDCGWIQCYNCLLEDYVIFQYERCEIPKKCLSCEKLFNKSKYEWLKEFIFFYFESEYPNM